jgi:predicted O-methyltransferase YrrM
MDVTPMTFPMFAQIEKAVADVPGWTPLDELYTLFILAYFSAGTAGNIAEIGSWCGRSTSALGLAARLSGSTRLTCIDLFPEKADWTRNADGTYSFSVKLGGSTYGGYQDQTVWPEAFEAHHAKIYERYNGIYDAFKESIARNGLQDLVDAHRGDSDVLRGFPEDSYRLAFLDGDHSYDAVCKDIRNVDRVLVRGGWICFDDAFSHYEGVNQAISDLIIASPDYELCQQMTRKLFIARKKKG